ncbi:MAG: electron transport complex subunit RsxC [Natronincolaceae bacterium]|jgi:electron transport complex protein RnfC|nr:electron transport complex subunit RsxC [Bacillota bacterium]NLK91037.1 electron transport complex subunit RsxC [Clostridiales bacterium]
MKSLTFRGGIHPPGYKETTAHLEVEKAVEPSVVFIPLKQHAGAPCQPLVKVGDRVTVGERIGESDAFISALVHSSVSGTVKEITKIPDATGGEVQAVVIESDGLNEVHPSVKPAGGIESLKPEEIVAAVRNAGIVGMGGATFPTHVKITELKDKKVDNFILNGAECEPYLTADHRLMLENPEDIIYGLRAMMKAKNSKNGFIGIEDNKPDAIKAMKKAAEHYPNIKIVALHTKYPQGASDQLVYACIGKEVPAGGSSSDAGVVVHNVATAAQVAKVLKTGMPSIDRITTVAGNAIANPKNLLIKVGVPIKEVIEQCGGYSKTPGKIIMGGPMMGIAQYTDDVVITKGSSGLLIFDEEEAKIPEPEQCIRCGKCVEICPVNLQPLLISAYSLNNMMEHAEKYRAADCIECGSCSFICPSKRPLLQSIRVAKAAIAEKKRKQSN